ncbi:monoacylglycerol lipase [Holotrichia oblita]|uniref:Monoacylglycerol lipase n=1 Tax=Holotrichia oblita TaxID=644536 RepID=A0ACB9TFN7_HOLOL|nr:monoacylglycerol lipase [Holotrichia oblita]
MGCCDLEVLVPWGQITIKAWGDSTNEPVLMLHGILDNAGSFDSLVPLLPSNFYYLCVDLPGHGLSSHFPPNLPIHFLNFVYALRIVAAHFKREKYTFICHSFGGRVSTLFTQLYPELVSKIAILDVGYIPVNHPDRFFQQLIHGFEILDKTLSFEPQRTPSYTYEEAINKVIKNRMIGMLTYPAAEQLVKRMTKKVSEDKYKFTFDQRLRGIISPSFSSEYIKEIFKKYPMTCPAICIITTSTKKIAKRQVLSNAQVPGFKYYEVKGHHHSHQTNPELFAPILTRFLTRQKHKL